MSKAIIADLDLWLASIATGACMAFAYDFLRLFRRLVRHGRFAVDVEDLLYWTICFFVSFVLLYYGNNGVIRFVAVFGAALGMLLYVVSIGRIFVKVGYFLINMTIGSVFRFLGRIMRKLHKMMRSVMHRNKEILKKVGIITKIQKIKRNLLTHCFFYNTINKNFKLEKQGLFNRQICAEAQVRAQSESRTGKEGSSRGKKRIKKQHAKKKKDTKV